MGSFLVYLKVFPSENEANGEVICSRMSDRGVNSAGYSVFDEPIRAREKCYLPASLILMCHIYFISCSTLSMETVIVQLIVKPIVHL